MTVYCPNCGKPNTDEAATCVSCGTALRKTEGKAKFKGTMMMTGPTSGPAPGPAPGAPPPAQQPEAAPAPKKDLAFQATMLGPMTPPPGQPAAAPQDGFGAAPQAPQGGFGAAPQAPQGGFGAAPQAPQGGFGGAPQAPQGGFGAAPQAPQGGFGSAPAQPQSGFGAPSDGGFAQTAPAQPQGGFGAPVSGGFGAAPDAGGGFGQAPPGGGFGQPAQAGLGGDAGGGFGQPAQASGGFGQPAPGAPAGGFGAPPAGGPPPGGPMMGAPGGGGGGNSKKIWIGVGVGCLVLALVTCVGSYFYCKSKAEEFGEGMQQFGAELTRISVGVTLAQIPAHCAMDASGASAARFALHPNVQAQYQPMLCQITDQVAPAFSRNCDSGQRPCSTAVVSTGTPHESRATSLGLDPNTCFAYTSGSAVLVGCSMAGDGFKIIHLENIAAVQ